MRQRGIVPWLMVGVIVLIGCMCVPLGAPVAEAQMRLRWAHNMDESHPSIAAAKQFVAAVDARTKGAIKIDIYPANTLGSPPEQSEQVRLGVIDMALPSQGQLDKYVKAFGAVMLPFAYDDLDHAHRVLDGPALQWFQQQSEKEGFLYLYSWEYGFHHIANRKRPVNTPADMKGLKLRTAPELAMQATFEAMGATTAIIAFAEVYMALSQGVVDGLGLPIAAIYFNKYYETIKHLALTQHLYNSLGHTISTKTWAKLTPEQRVIFQEESRNAAAYMRQEIKSQEADLIAKMEKTGIQVTRPDPAAFRPLMGPAYERIEKYVGADNVKKYREFIEAARKK
jgi:TRAP-type transport system periplasmic protein